MYVSSEQRSLFFYSSPPEEHAAFNLVCGETVVAPKIGSLYRIRVTYEPQSYYLKVRTLFSACLLTALICPLCPSQMFAFLRIASDSPIASATLIFDEEKMSCKWYPLYKRGHPEFQKLPMGVLKDFDPDESETLRTTDGDLLNFFGNARILGDSYYSEPPKERATTFKPRVKSLHMAFVARILLVRVLMTT